MDNMVEELPRLLEGEREEELRRDFHFPRKEEPDERPEKSGERLEEEQSCYLDHAGATLAGHSQLQEVFSALAAGPLSNPHSMGPLGSRCEDIIEKTRLQVLHHFGADPAEYDCVFTSGSTSALKLVAECFPWDPRSALVYPFNSHTSVVGMREYAPSAYCVPSGLFHSNNQYSVDTNLSDLNDLNNDRCDEVFYSLLAVPGECNFSGMKMDRPLHELFPQQLHPIESTSTRGLLVNKGWPGTLSGTASVKCSDTRRSYLAGSSSRKREVVLWMLDASKLAATSSINLSKQGIPPCENFAEKTEGDRFLLRPHFMCVSFYKIFGYPTGVGALLVRKDVSHLLKKNYFGGGTVSGVIANSDVMTRPSVVQETGLVHNILEDGTLNYHGIAALNAGFSALKRAGGMANIQRYCFQLIHHLYLALVSLKHDNGNNVCEIYGRHSEACSTTQGSILTFNILWADGTFVGFGHVGEKAISDNIQIRVGCFCSIGGCQEALGMSACDVQLNLQRGRTCQDSSFDLMSDGRPTGAVRVSVGYMTSAVEATSRLLRFLDDHYVNKLPPTSEINEDVNNINIATSETSIKPSVFSTDYVHSIYVYPIKSCAGCKVKVWPVSSTGLYLDREWVVVNAITGVAMTQKTHPLLSRCIPSINLATQELSIFPPPSSKLAPLVLYLEEAGKESGLEDSAMKHIRVCFSQHVGQRCTLSADEWFSSVLDTQCQLVRRSSIAKFQNGTSQSNNKPNGTKENETSFSNSAQFLLLSMSSFRGLLTKMKGSNVNTDLVSVESFRPNFVVDQEESAQNEKHEEDFWQAVTLSLRLFDTSSQQFVKTTNINSNLDVSLTRIGPCARCSMVNIIPPSAGSSFVEGTDSVAMKNPSTLRTLSTYRKGQHGAGGNQAGDSRVGKNDIYFGQYFAYTNDSQTNVNASAQHFGFVHEKMPLHVEKYS